MKRNFIALLIIPLIYGCSVREPLQPQAFVVPDKFSQTGQLQAPVKWWQSFANTELNQSIEQALAQNNPLSAQRLKTKSARLGITSAQASLYPSLSFRGATSTNIDPIDAFDSASLALNASWEMDLWGKLDATESRAIWQYQQQQGLLAAQSNNVATGVLSQWLNIIAGMQKLEVLDKQHQRTQMALGIIERRFALGKSSVTNIWQQQKLLKSIESSQAKAKSDIFLAKQRYALWLGQYDEQQVSVNLKQLPPLPAMPVLGIPTAALAGRPDIQQALAKVQIANDNVAIALAERLPRFTLKAGYGANQNSTKVLFDNWLGTLSAELLMPVFDAGKRKANAEQKQLLLEASLKEYQQTWIDAYRSVNRALQQEQYQQALLQNYQAQLELAQKAEHLTSIKYLNNKVNFLSLLNAQEAILILEHRLIDTQKALLLNRVVLYRELSHGDFNDPNDQSEHLSQVDKES